MAKVNYYIYQGKKSDDERVEIKIRFVLTQYVSKRLNTGIFISPNNWDEEKGWPKERRSMKFADECREVSDRLHVLSDYLLDRWLSMEGANAAEIDFKQWMDDIVWISKDEVVQLGDKEMKKKVFSITTREMEDAKKKEEKIQKSKIENRYFLDVFDEYVNEMLHTGAISQVRHKTYHTCTGVWDRMERYKGVRYTVKDVTTDTLNDFRAFILEEHKLWEIKPVKNKKGKVIGNAPCPKSPYKYIYEGYDSTLSRGVEARSLNYVVVMIKYIKAYWHWLTRVKKIQLDDIFASFKLEPSVYGTPYFLGKDDRNIMFKADLSSRPALAVQRDIFVFQSLIGCRCGDLYRFTRANIINGEYLQYVAGKTKNKSGKILTIPLHPDAKTILERYSNLADGRLLPFISEQKYNHAIKEIFKAIPEIDYTVTILDPVTRLETQKKLHEIASSHMARRNFCGNLYDAGFRDSDISSMSGHTEGSVAIARYRKVSDETKHKMIDAL